MSDFNPLPVPADLLEHPLEVFVLQPRKRPYWLHALLFLLTCMSMLVVGSKMQYNFDHGLPLFVIEKDVFPVAWAVGQPSHLLLGLPFTATLMLILLAHEMGHFVYCQRYGVYATLPYFLPAPTLIGTLGAFIRIKSPIRSRAALFDIGVAGPIAGFVLAVPLLALGLGLSHQAPQLVAQSDVRFGYPLIFYLFQGVLPWSRWGIGLPAQLYLHPIAMGAWVGMLATALNLLPGGQLDGGHILYALWPRAHRWITRGTALALLLFGLWQQAHFYRRTEGWSIWFLWALVVLITGLRHPPVPAWPPIGRKRYALAALALVILVLSFIPMPIAGAEESSTAPKLRASAQLGSWGLSALERESHQRYRVYIHHHGNVRNLETRTMALQVARHGVEFGAAAGFEQ